jgi:hypothetical protein
MQPTDMLSQQQQQQQPTVTGEAGGSRAVLGAEVGRSLGFPRGLCPDRKPCLPLRACGSRHRRTGPGMVQVSEPSFGHFFAYTAEEAVGIRSSQVADSIS